MKLTGVVISDTHNRLNDVVDRLPSADFLIHCGDLTGHGTAAEGLIALQTLGQVRAKYKAILLTAGNHDWFAYHAPDYWTKVAAEEYGLNLLLDRGVEYEQTGIKFYGAPWQPFFHDWAFNFPNPEVQGGEKLAADAAIETWAKIPDDVSVLITHGPPLGILDEVLPVTTWQGKEYVDTRAGCPHLRERLKALPLLKVHAFGHIHEANGQKVVDGVRYINGAICDRAAYDPVQPYQEFEIITIDRIGLAP